MRPSVPTWKGNAMCLPSISRLLAQVEIEMMLVAVDRILDDVGLERAQMGVEIAEHAIGDRHEQDLAVALALLGQRLPGKGRGPCRLHRVVDRLSHTVRHVVDAAGLELTHRGYPVLTLTERRSDVAGGNGCTGIIGVTGMPMHVSPAWVWVENTVTRLLR